MDTSGDIAQEISDPTVNGEDQAELLKQSSPLRTLTDNNNDNNNNNNEPNDNSEQNKVHNNPRDEFINKLTTDVQSYINECFILDELDSTDKKLINNPILKTNTDKNIDCNINIDDNNNFTSDNNNNNNVTKNDDDNVHIESTKPVKEPKKAEPTKIIHKMLTLPSIHITNEFGQESVSIDNTERDAGQPAVKHPGKKPEKTAIVVRDLSFSYLKKTPVLSNVNLIVPKAQIFALLGASGCGKTTLLRLLLGRLKPQKGEIRVFGYKPGSVYTNIPGSGVGFMPQELSIWPSFTIGETLYYFGLLHQLSKPEIEKRIDFMIDLLNLPPKDRRMEQCSGGQQRRASIALTLFHSPPLLILDEPTVGVDPLLRLKIWQYLEYLCINNRMTIIITTHYIEESRTANNLAFMRFGRILAQESPDKLLTHFNTTVLEDVFLKLCQQDTEDHTIKQKFTINENQITNELQRHQEMYGQDMEPVRSKYYNISIDSTRMKALLFKNLISLQRNPIIFFFFLLLPTIQIILFCFSVYKMPNHIDVSVYNEDKRGLSKQYLSYINSDVLTLHYYNSYDEAIQSVWDGKTWASVVMMKNFSQAYRKRAKNPTELTELDYNNSKIMLFTDQTDNFIYDTVQIELKEAYQRFVANVAESFGYNPATVQLPVIVENPVYGSMEKSLFGFLIPGAMTAIIYTTPLLLGAMVIVMERKDQIIERTFVNGATSVELFLSHLITMLLSLIIQVIVLMLVPIYIFHLKILGSYVQTFLLLYLQGCFGILIGLLISSIAKNEMTALLLSLSMVFPVWMISGVFWPLESVEHWLQKLFWLFPVSVPIRSLSLMIARGYVLQHPEVFLAFIISLCCNGCLFILNLVVFHWTSC